MATGSYTTPPYQLIGSYVESIQGNPGLVAIKEQSYSATATCDIYDIFSREYHSYQIFTRFKSSVINNYVSMQYLTNTTVVGAGTYENAGQYQYYPGTTHGNWCGTGVSSNYVGYNNTTTDFTFGMTTIHMPYERDYYTTMETTFDSYGVYWMWGTGVCKTAAMANGLRFQHNGAGNLTGNVYVYGCRKEGNMGA